MTNFRDPAVIAQDSLVMVKLWHTVFGLYIWEYVTTLEYEWNVIRGRIPYRWTIWIYSLARATVLFVIIFGFVMMDAKGPINCQAMISLINVFAFLTMSTSSLLIVLRMYVLNDDPTEPVSPNQPLIDVASFAIWNKNKIVGAIAFSIWVINAASFLQRVVRLRSVWVPAQLSCVPENTTSIEFGLITMLVTDIALLLIMLLGLYRLRLRGVGTYSLVQFLWRQGVIWLLLATVAEVPPVVFARLNLNVPFNIMLQPPSWAILTIAATRMHRALVDFSSESTDGFSGNEFTSLPVTQAKRTNAASLPVDCMQVAVHVVSEQHRIPEVRDGGSYVTVNERTYVKPDGLSHDDDVERGT